MTNKKSLFEIIKAFFFSLFRPEYSAASEIKKADVFKKTSQAKSEIFDVAPEIAVSSDESDDMSWPEFETLIIKLFQQRNYSLVEKRAVTDNASDLVLEMNNEITLVDCKQWKEAEVDVHAVSDLYDLMGKENIDHGIVVTSGIFTRNAVDFSLGKAVLLINGQDLFQMVQALSSSKSYAADVKLDENEVVNEPPGLEMPELEPLCPICSMKMIKRTAKKGKKKGNHFWGCSQYPRCRGVVAVD